MCYNKIWELWTVATSFVVGKLNRAEDTIYKERFYFNLNIGKYIHGSINIWLLVIALSVGCSYV